MCAELEQVAWSLEDLIEMTDSYMPKPGSAAHTNGKTSNAEVSLVITVVEVLDR